MRFFRKTNSTRRSCIYILRAEARKYCGKRSAILPGSLANSGYLSLVGQLAEADAADAIVTQVSVGAAADLAAIVLAGGELSRSLLLENN